MLRLIFKDILLQKKRLVWFPFLYSSFIIFIVQKYGSSGISGSFIISGVVISYLLLQTVIYYENVNRSPVVINSLPVSKSRIVAARYLSIFAYLGISVFSYWFVRVILTSFFSTFEIAQVSFSGLSSILLVLAFLSAVYLPIYYKFGYINARIFHIVFMLAAFFLPAKLFDIIEDLWGLEVSGGIYVLNNFNLSSIQVNLCMVLGSLLLLAISYYVSLYFYRQWEF